MCVGEGAGEALCVTLTVQSTDTFWNSLAFYQAEESRHIAVRALEALKPEISFIEQLSTKHFVGSLTFQEAFSFQYSLVHYCTIFLCCLDAEMIITETQIQITDII